MERLSHRSTSNCGRVRFMLGPLEREVMEILWRVGECSEKEMVFPSPEGTVLDPDNLYHRYFLLVLAKAGIRKVWLHDLRHTFGSLLIQAGASIVYVKEQMGHSSIQVTVDIYGHLIPGANVAYVDRLDARLTQTPQTSANAR